MRIVRKDEFGDLSTAVIYKFNKFLPTSNSYNNIDGLRETVNGVDEIIKYSSDKVLHHGTTKKFDNIDFAEYDFSYILENQKFNNKDLINYLDAKSRARLGSDLVTSEKINSTIFPTTSDEEEYDGYDYFGSLTLSTVTVYLFNLDPSCYKIELYEDNIEYNSTVKIGNNYDTNFYDTDYLKLTSKFWNDSTNYRVGEVVRYYVEGSNTETTLYTSIGNNVGKLPTDTNYWKKFVEPAVTIYLGPEKSAAENPSNWYYPQDPDWYNPRKPYGPGYQELSDELTSGKAVWLALSKDNSIKELNLSYNAWLLSEDANRYKHLYTLRNDEFYGVKDKFNVVTKGKELDNNVIDVRSGNLLGNTQLSNREKTPILYRKQNNYRQESQYGEDVTSVPYRPEITYKIGDRVFMYNPDPHGDSQVFVSVKNNNRAHYPGLSTYWVNEDRIKDCITERITVISDPIEAGITQPSSQFTLTDTSVYRDYDLKIFPNPGYKFNSSIKYEEKSGRRQSLYLDEDYTITTVVTPTENYQVVTIRPIGWYKILGGGVVEGTRKRIIVGFDESYVTIMGKAPDPLQRGNFGDFAIWSTDSGNTSIIKEGDIGDPSDAPYVHFDSILVNGVTGDEEKTNELTYGSDVEFRVSAVGCKGIDSVKVLLEKEGNIFIPEDLNIIYERDERNNPSSRFSFKLLGTSYYYLINATTDIKVDVVEYDGFEVDNVALRFDPESSESHQINFYGTYKDNFKELIVRYDGRDVVIGNNSLGSKFYLDGLDIVDTEDNTTRPYVELTKSGQMYTITLQSLKENTTIKILGK